MCLSVNNPSSKVNEVVASSGLPLFILDECGYSSHVQSPVRAEVDNGVTRYSNYVVLKCDHCEDG